MRIRHVLGGAGLVFAVALVARAQPDRINGRAFATRSPVLAQHGMVCTSQPLALQAGLDVLTAGGSAIDAAIAGLGLVEPVTTSESRKEGGAVGW